MEPAPVAAFKDAVRRRAGSLKPYQMAASDFDVAFITPVLNYAAQSQSNQTFSNWSEYVADIPPVLFVRVTPKMVESLWAKVARGAAQTQGMALPAIKHLTSGLPTAARLLRSDRGDADSPVQTRTAGLRDGAIYEGLYVFDPAALGPECGTVTLVLHSEKEPEKADTRVVDPKVLQQIRRDFALNVSP